MNKSKSKDRPEPRRREWNENFTDLKQHKLTEAELVVEV